MTASIITSSEVYHIEPSRHYIKKPHPFHMIAYKWSHVKDRMRGHRMDYVTGPTVPTDDNLESESVLEKSNFHSNRADDESGHNRLKRQTVSRLPGGIGGRACPMILVADFTIFERLGNDERSVLVQLVSAQHKIHVDSLLPQKYYISCNVYKKCTKIKLRVLIIPGRSLYCIYYNYEGILAVLKLTSSVESGVNAYMYICGATICTMPNRLSSATKLG